MLAVILAQTFALVVFGGTGSGSYPCGTAVQIVAEKKHGDQPFAQWHLGWDGDTTIVKGRIHQRKITIKTPCHDVTAEAKFTAKPPKAKS